MTRGYSCHLFDFCFKLLVSLSWYCHGGGDYDDEEQLFALIMHCEESCELNPTSDLTSGLNVESQISSVYSLTYVYI